MDGVGFDPDLLPVHKNVVGAVLGQNARGIGTGAAKDEGADDKAGEKICVFHGVCLL